MNSNIILITGPGLNHRYFVNRLNREFAVECVFVEEVDYPEYTAKSQKLQQSWKWFFERREEYEKKLFSESELWPKKNQPEIIPITAGQLNTAETLKNLQDRQPEIIILFGSSLVGQKTINSFPDKIINLHVGISGHYRGSSSNFWPIFDEKLDSLGATVLTINAGIDTGVILAQSTIKLKENDTEQSLMGKCLVLGLDLTIQVVHQWFDGKCTPLDLKRNGKLFQKKDFTPEAISKVKEMVDNGHLKALIRAQLKSEEKAI